jgi:hypothetical protein
MMRRAAFIYGLLISASAWLWSSSQASSRLDSFFRQNIELTQAQINAVARGQAVTKTLPSRTAAEVFLFGAIYINAAPERYLEYSGDFDRLRKLPNYIALGVVGKPPQLSDLKDFSFDNDDIQSLKNCKPGDCLIQMPAGSMEELRRSVNWSSAGVNDEVNRLLQKTALERILEYMQQGNRALGVYNDKRDPTEVPKAFAYMLGYSKALPERLPDFYNYLLEYPRARPTNVDETIYWERVKFGLKPTLRVVQRVVMRGMPNDSIAYAVAGKQLYSSHYFETALDLSFCVRDVTKPSGFYLVNIMGSEQAGLTGPKGAIVRKVAVGRSLSNLEDALNSIKGTLERN